LQIPKLALANQGNKWQEGPRGPRGQVGGWADGKSLGK